VVTPGKLLEALLGLKGWVLEKNGSKPLCPDVVNEKGNEFSFDKGESGRVAGRTAVGSIGLVAAAGVREHA
jgi:hypothetical protein